MSAAPIRCNRGGIGTRHCPVLDRRNENPKAFQWKAPVVEILRKVKRAWTVLHDRYGAQKPSAALASIERRLAAVENAAAQT